MSVGVALAVALVVADAVAVVLALALALACEVAFFVATGFDVFEGVCGAVCVATAFVDDDKDDDDDEAEAFVPSAAPPAMFIPPLELSCGGVIAKTAPSPPTVPPAINNARFISYPT